MAPVVVIVTVPRETLETFSDRDTFMAKVMTVAVTPPALPVCYVGLLRAYDLLPDGYVTLCVCVFLNRPMCPRSCFERLFLWVFRPLRTS